MVNGNWQLSRRGLLGGGLGLAAGAGMLAACGPSDGSGGSDGEPPEDLGSPEEGRLVVWGGVAPETGPQALVDAFMAKYPDIEVEYTRYVNDEEGILKLDTALQGGVPIDVYFSYGTVDVVRRSQAALALDLTDLAREDDLAQIFVQDEPISTLVDGKLFSIPTTHFPNFVVINQDAMEAAGIEIPFDWTVDDYHQIAQEFASAGFDVGAYNVPRHEAVGLGGDYLYTEDGTESNLDHPLVRERLEATLAMEDDGSIFTQERITAEGIGGYAQNYFLDGTFAMMLDGTIIARYVKNLEEYPHDFRTTFRPYPRLAAGEPYINPGVRGDDVQISAKSKYASAAWTFVKFWMGEGAELVTPSGKVSPFQYEDGPSDSLNEALFGPDADELFDVESFEQTFFAAEPPLAVRSITTAFTEISSIKSQIEEEIRLRTKSIDDGIAEMKTLADEAIDSWLE
ncbi:extracellular solute-binding protein family 1 [Beutenbergia cavernae DSM 12333]|uniref:Extracellular solute-binding protein family 1 n=1 Tax=Beutenbergia cavernae (strain ATCC BAA-8 / DSM 12333 / CCUG 43141 / JCM 11478 / NBRC 16432 / NCIMB 13614 / HKI 0122) TaxID=471853 RepID=C5C6L2_BEUC1|nr:extracellular solute-binding protein family 1 [Beutenbergia cavernae DSM 12333]